MRNYLHLNSIDQYKEFMALNKYLISFCTFQNKKLVAYCFFQNLQKL